MLENNWMRLLNKCMYVVTISFFNFPISKELYVFLKKRWPRPFKVYQALIICKKIAADDNAYLGWCWSKFWFFSYKRADFSVIVNISVKTLCDAIDTIFASFYIFYFFQIIMVSLFLLDMISILCLKMRNFSDLPIFQSKQRIIYCSLFC